MNDKKYLASIGYFFLAIKEKFQIIMPASIRGFCLIILMKIRKRQLINKYINLKIGKNVRISKGCFFGKGVRLCNGVSLNITNIGDYTYVAENSSINLSDIGKFCSIGPNVKIGIGMHPSRQNVSTHPAFFSIRGQSTIVFADKNYYLEIDQIKIGNDVWIGTDVIVRDGVSVGNGAIIGAGAVVVKDVEPYSIVGGVPAKFIRYRFIKEEIDFLEEIKWWDKSEEWMKKNWKDFLDIKKFVIKQRKH